MGYGPKAFAGLGGAGVGLNLKSAGPIYMERSIVAIYLGH